MTQVRGNLDIIVTEGERLTALINDLLDLAKMEAGRVEWRDEEVDVDAVVRQVAATVQPLFEEKDLPLDLELEPELPPVRGDRHRLEQVVINLLSNACKFTDAGAVTVRTRRQAAEVVVSVTDTGPGIAPADRGDLFVRFKQVGDTLTGKPQGTGLGLPICKEIVEHHGGHLDVESEVGQGTTFSFTLPLPIGRAEPPAAPAFRAPVVDAGTLLRDLRDSFGARRTDGPPHILVVDDHQPVRQLLRQELEGHGYVVHEAADGHEGFRMARALGPDLVTLDVMMPDVNGFDVAAALRQDPATMRIPLMMISVVHDEGRARAVGVDSYLTKPIDSVDLLEQVETLLAQGCATTARRRRGPRLRDGRDARLGARGPRVAGDPRRQPRHRRRGGAGARPRRRHRPGRPGRPVPPRRRAPRGPRDRARRRRPLRVRYPLPGTPSRKILIVDDEAHIRTLLEQTLEDLEDEGVELLTAADGAAGLALVEAERPDLVFLDVMMPSMNGYEVCRAVRTDLGLTDVTIVLLTAKGQEADRRRAVEVGADEFLTKPFDPDELLDLARSRLGALDEDR